MGIRTFNDVTGAQGIFLPPTYVLLLLKYTQPAYNMLGAISYFCFQLKFMQIIWLSFSSLLKFRDFVYDVLCSNDKLSQSLVIQDIVTIIVFCVKYLICSVSLHSRDFAMKREQKLKYTTNTQRVEEMWKNQYQVKKESKSLYSKYYSEHMRAGMKVSNYI